MTTGTSKLKCKEEKINKQFTTILRQLKKVCNICVMSKTKNTRNIWSKDDGEFSKIDDR